MALEHPRRLGELLREARLASGFSAREVARRADVDVSTITRLEQGEFLSPNPDRLTAIAAVLNLPAADVFAAADWIPHGDLPTFRPYLRAKYHDLAPEAVAEIEAAFDQIIDKHRFRGPQNNEDEQD